MKTEYFIIGQNGYLNTNITCRDGYRCWGFTYTRKIQTWKNKAKAEAWLVRALEEDQTAKIIEVM